MTYIKNKDEPIYTISIAAKLVRPPLKAVPGAAENTAKPIHAQTLRMYDRLELVRPRKVGKNRFYSDRDIERLQQIQHLTQNVKINLAGVAYIFEMLDQMLQMQTPMETVEAMLRSAEAAAARVEEKRGVKTHADV